MCFINISKKETKGKLKKRIKEMNKQDKVRKFYTAINKIKKKNFNPKHEGIIIIIIQAKRKVKETPYN